METQKTMDYDTKEEQLYRKYREQGFDHIKAREFALKEAEWDKNHPQYNGYKITKE